MRRFARFACWSLLVVVLLVAFGLGWWVWLAREYEGRVDALRAAGQPVAPADLAPPPVPDDEDAAPLLRRAGAWYRAQQADPARPIPEALREWRDTAEWADGDWRAVGAWLDGAGEFLGLLEAAARRQAARFDVRWEDGAAMQIPAIPFLMEATTVLHAAALVEARGGRLDRAVDHVETMLGVGGLLEGLSGVHYGFRVTFQTYALATMEEVLLGRQVDAARLRARLELRLRDLEDPSLLVGALRAERALGLDATRGWLDGESPRLMLVSCWFESGSIPDEVATDLPDALWSSFVMRPFAYRDGIAFLEMMGEAIAACEASDASTGARLRALADEAEAREFPFLVARAYGPLPLRMYRMELDYRARVRVARVGLAVHEYRQRHGAWPRTLEDVAGLVGGRVPRDPFGDKPFSFVAEEESAKIAADQPVPAGESPEEYEISWVVKPG